MVEFSSPYYNNLDRGYYPPGEARSEPLDIEVGPMPTIYPEADTAFQPVDGEPAFTVKDIGQGVPLGIAANNVAGVDAKLRSGVGHVELQFPGALRSNRQSHTPGVYGEDQRTALRELKKAREVTFTTHSSFGIMGLAGQDQQGNYSKEQRKIAIDEVKRAIEFAGDVAEGGSVVVHTGEFQRPISEAVTPDEIWRWQTDNKGNIIYQTNPETGKPEPVPMFRGYQEEAERAIIRVVDDRTGQVMQQVRKNQRIATANWRQITKDSWKSKWHNQIGEKRILHYSVPDDTAFIKIWEGKKDEFGNKYFEIIRDEKGEIQKIIPGKRPWKWDDYVDYENKIIINPLDVEHGRLPEYNKDTGRFEVAMRDWNYFVKEANEWNRLERERRKKLSGSALGVYDMVTPEERYIRSTLETNEGYSRGWALQFSVSVKEQLTQIENMRKALAFYETLEDNIPEKEKWKIMMKKPEYNGIVSMFVPSDSELPSELLKKALWREERNLAYYQESGLSQEKQAKDSRETQIHIKSAWKYALEEAQKSYAALGISAMEESVRRNLSDPITVTMENIFPESYGAHPQELKNLVLTSRNKMIEMLTKEKILDPMRVDSHGNPVEAINPYFKKGINKEQAEKLAEQHIKATFDTGHLNVWRKYFQGSDKDFNKWYLQQVEDLAKNKIIGNVHLADNYGYQDDHLSPGQGNAPIKESLEILKKYGYSDKIIVEPGGAATTDNSDVHGLMQTWRYFGNLASPTGAYMGGQRQGADTWTDVQSGYFGKTYPPNFVFGSYTPSQDWTLWTQVPME